MSMTWVMRLPGAPVVSTSGRTTSDPATLTGFGVLNVTYSCSTAN